MAAEHLDGTLDITVIIVAFFTLVASLTASFLAYFAQKHARQTNDAVNHRHEGEPKLVDMVVNIGTELEEHRTANRDQHERLAEAIQKNWDALHHHVKWEETVKYPEIEAAMTPPKGTKQKEGPK